MSHIIDTALAGDRIINPPVKITSHSDDDDDKSARTSVVLKTNSPKQPVVKSVNYEHSRYNSLDLGTFSEADVLFTENAKVHDMFCQSYITSLKPFGQPETSLVLQIANCDWKLMMRLPRAERGLYLRSLYETTAIHEVTASAAVLPYGKSLDQAVVDFNQVFADDPEDRKEEISDIEKQSRQVQSAVKILRQPKLKVSEEDKLKQATKKLPQGIRRQWLERSKGDQAAQNYRKLNASLKEYLIGSVVPYLDQKLVEVRFRSILSEVAHDMAHDPDKFSSVERRRTALINQRKNLLAQLYVMQDQQRTKASD